jgi:hypothetical protein
MVTVTKKHQTSMALIAVVLATAMIAGTFAMGNNVFAWAKSHDNNKGKNGIGTGLDNLGFSNFGKGSGQTAAADQSIDESCDQNQNSPVTTSGLISPPVLSGINLGLCVNANAGGNSANQDQSTQN